MTLTTYELVVEKVASDKAHKLSKLSAALTTNGGSMKGQFIAGNRVTLTVPRPDKRFKGGVRQDVRHFHKPHHTNLDGLAALIHQHISDLK